MGKITYTPSRANFVNNTVLYGEQLNDKINNKDNVITGIIEGLSAYYEKTGQPDKNITASDASTTVAPIIGTALSGIIYDNVKNRGLKFSNTGITLQLRENDNFQITNLPLNVTPTSENLLCIDNSGVIKKVDLEQASPAEPSSTEDTAISFISSITQDTYGKIHATKKYIMALKDVSYDAESNKLILTTATGSEYRHITIGDNYTEKCYFSAVYKLMHENSVEYYVYVNVIDPSMATSDPDAERFVKHIAEYNGVFLGLVVNAQTGTPVGNEIFFRYSLDEEGNPTDYFIMFDSFDGTRSNLYMYEHAYGYEKVQITSKVLIEKQVQE